MKVQIAGSGCSRCRQLERNVINALAVADIPAKVEHVYDVAELVKLGVRLTPALLLDGKVVFAGKVPSVFELREILSRYKE